MDAAGASRRLRINVDPFFSRLVLAGELAGFLTEHRDLRLELVMGDLVADGFDLGDLFPDWLDEVFPLVAIYPSPQHRAAKIQVFTDFCLRLLGR